MRKNYLLSAILLMVALVGARVAWSKWEEAGRVAAESAALRTEIAALKAEQQTLEALQETLPAKFAADALSDFFSTAIEAGEVLGAGVRIEARGNEAAGAPQFEDFKHGLRVAPVAVQAAAELATAPALFSLLEEELHALPVVVRKIEARSVEEAVTLRMEVDVFGR